MKNILFFLFCTCFSIGYAQIAGEFRSRDWSGDTGDPQQKGLWTDYRTWQIYNGSVWQNAVANQYPGQTGYHGRNVTIRCFANAPVRIDKGTYAIGGSLTVEGTLEILNNNGTVEFTNYIPLNSTNSNPIQVRIHGGRILWAGNGNLKFPANSTIAITNTPVCTTDSYGLIGNSNCSASQLLYIGLIKYSSCNGGGGVVAGSFEDINDAGGSLIASPYADPVAVCTASNTPITLLGSAIGNTESLGTLSYSWEYDSGPVATVSIPTTDPQNPNIGLLTVAGDYKFYLRVTSRKKNGDTYADRKEFIVSVDGTTTFNGTTWSNDIPSVQNHRHAVISSPYVTADRGAFSACSCTVKAGQKLTVSADTTVNLVGKLTNNGTAENVVIESDGNLIQKLNVPNTDAVTVQRYVTDMDNVLATQMDYIYWSAPVSGQKLRGTAEEGGFSPGTPNNRFFEYNESNDYFVSTPDVTFKAGKGYAIRAEDGFDNGYNKTYEFKGVPNNGDVPILIKRSVNTGVGGTVIHGYNLVGNPYPSNIDFDVLYANNSGLIYNTAWFWTNTYYTPNQQGSSYSGNNYAVYNGTGGNNAPSTGGTAAASSIIKAGQGFLVQVRTAPGTSGNLNFKNSYNGQNLRVSTGGAFYQKGGGEKNRFWLNLVSPNGIANSQLIGYVEGATYGYEQDYDAEILELSSDIFYSQSGDRKLLIQGKGAFTDSDKVLLGANFFSEGSYMITLQQAEGIFAVDQEIWLKDHETGSTVNLSKEKNYRFKAKKGESSGRFEILYQNLGSVVALQESPRESLTVYKDGDHFVVKATEQISSVEIYDAAGKLLSRTESFMSQARVNAAQLNPGVYILRITHNGKVSTRKILK